MLGGGTLGRTEAGGTLWRVDDGGVLGRTEGGGTLCRVDGTGGGPAGGGMVGRKARRAMAEIMPEKAEEHQATRA